jgi:lipoprotein-anchoring transpeptidase ErfK/SrfK
MTRVAARIISLIAIVALLATACGGGGGDDEAAEETATPTEEQTATADSSEGDSTEEPTEASTEAEETDTGEWEVAVLTAKDTTGVVPTFDSPDGTEVFYEIPVANPTYFGNTLSLLVIDGEEGDDWVEVQLPVRPAETTAAEQPEVFAWVQTEYFDWTSHEYHATVDLSDHFVQVWEGDELITESAAVTGRPAAPTPTIRTYVDEIIPGDGAGYGSWILSLAGYSQELEWFDGGLPKLALHGTNAPELVGQEISSGCVRLPNEIIELLATTIPVGTVVEIIA